MARNNPLPKSELEILARLKSCRRGRELPRRLFAKAADLDSSIIVRLELARMPLRFGAARALCAAHLINPQWLATGEGDPVVARRDQSLNKIQADEHALFSEVFKTFIMPSLHNSPSKNPADILPRGILVDFWSHVISQAFDIVAREDFYELDCQIRTALQNVMGYAPDEPEIEEFRRYFATIAKENKHLYKRFTTRPHGSRKATLDNRPAPRDSAAVPEITSLTELIEQLRKLTAARGQKKALADKLGVTRQAVDQWLSENAKPSAEVLFALLNWVRSRRKQNQK